MSDLQDLIQLRDCFQGGYTLPQYCLDNGIEKPLIIARKKNTQVIWEIHVQFRFDKRVKAQFCLLDSAAKEIDFSVRATVSKLKTQAYSKELIDDCDKIIFLSSDREKLKMDKTIYLDDLTEYFINKTYAEIPLLSFLQRYPKVKLFVTNFPHITRYEDGADFNKELKSLEEMMELFRNKKDATVETPLDKFGYTNAQVYDLMRAPRIINNPYGAVPLEDTPTDSIQQIRGGKRRTAYQPEHFEHRIWFVGSCHQYGINAPFDKTIESYLQLMLNEAKLPWRVENEGQHYFNRRQDLFFNLNAIDPAPGDIIFVWINDRPTSNVPFFDVSDVFDPPVDYKEIFTVKGHGNERGYKLLAEKTFAFLTEHNFFRDEEFTYPPPPPPRRRYGIPLQFEHWDEPVPSKPTAQPVANKSTASLVPPKTQAPVANKSTAPVSKKPAEPQKVIVKPAASNVVKIPPKAATV